ncbi:MAG TPA: DUF192 domain-containing protein [Candidatus Paceibacterota bacterium]|nr:DUF192 domain-containing protein [Candidatus Paceibacterota bacterium]
MGSIVATVALGVLAIVGGLFMEKNSQVTHPAAPQSTVTVVAATSTKPFPDSSYKHARVTIGGEAFDALVSDTDTLREEGLSDRNGLSQGQAMLFVFDKPDLLGFWMKDMHFSIDMLWLDSNFRVVSFKEDATPESYPKVFFPSGPSRYVVELPAGTLTRLGIKAGDLVSVSL